uniref:(northern house mosquito) hypothetical protein n=1 Tax=Culex pipiens TaxID=7175 RepID=A0A8D8HDJ8_CULPI
MLAFRRNWTRPLRQPSSDLPFPNLAAPRTTSVPTVVVAFFVSMEPATHPLPVCSIPLFQKSLVFIEFLLFTSLALFWLVLVPKNCAATTPRPGGHTYANAHTRTETATRRRVSCLSRRGHFFSNKF